MHNTKHFHKSMHLWSFNLPLVHLEIILNKILINLQNSILITLNFTKYFPFNYDYKFKIQGYKLYVIKYRME